jgi:hypothetical protein
MVNTAPYEIFSFGIVSGSEDVGYGTRKLEEIAQQPIESDLDYSRPRNLNFTWTLTSASDLALQFKLNFTNPIDVSAVEGTPDRLVVNFTNNKIFQYVLLDEHTFQKTNYSVSATLKQ